GNAMTITPNGTQVWANGGDACIASAYDHAGCPVVPAGVVNVLRTADNAVIQTLAFVNGAGFITRSSSFSFLTFLPVGGSCVDRSNSGYRLAQSFFVQPLGQLP